MVKPLDPQLVKAIYSEMRDGFQKSKSGDADEAAKHIRNAWSMVPEPCYEWDVSQSLVIRIAKFFRDQKDFAEAFRWARDIQLCSPSAGDAEPDIVLGSVYLDSGDPDQALEFFQKAFDKAGKRGFEGEDPRYLACLKVAKPKL